LRKILVIFLVLFISLVAGLIAASGSTIFVVAFAGMCGAVFLAFSPALLFGSMIVFSLAVTGVAEFYFFINQVNWVASLMGLALLVMALLTRLKSTQRQPLRVRPPLPSTTGLIALYVLLLLLSSAMNRVPLVQLLIGVRYYLCYMGVYFALQSYANSDNEQRLWVKMVLGFGLVQLPFCLHQAIFIAPKRAHSLQAVGEGVESIVGSFGGNQLGGGYTGEMAVFTLLASALAIALAPSLKHGRLLATIMCISALGCVGLAETKIVFVLTPIVLGIVLWEQIRSSSRYMFGVVFGASAALGLVGAVYAWRFWTKGPGEFWHAFTYSFDPNFMVDRLHRGRVATLVHWWDHNVLHFDLLHSLLGYGMGASVEQSSILRAGNAVLLFGVGLDSHAASKLLWDGGLLGLGMLVLIILRSGWNAHRAVSMAGIPDFHRNVLKMARAAMFCFAAMLPYQVSIVGGAPMQFLFWFFVGYIEYWRAQARRS
jgi:hypothetical protein